MRTNGDIDLAMSLISALLHNACRDLRHSGFEEVVFAFYEIWKA